MEIKRAPKRNASSTHGFPIVSFHAVLSISGAFVVDQKNFFEQIKKQPASFLIIHYSSENLYDEGLQGLSPRITSIVVKHYDAGQIRSF